MTVHSDIAHRIKRVGRAVMCIGGDAESPPFAYTIGNHFKGLPELLAIGTLDGDFLNPLSEMMITSGAAFADGELVRLPGAECAVKVIRADPTARRDYTIQAGRHFGADDYDVMQVVIPDPDGKFPGDAGCAAPYRDWPILRTN